MVWEHDDVCRELVHYTEELKRRPDFGETEQMLLHVFGMGLLIRLDAIRDGKREAVKKPEEKP